MWPTVSKAVGTSTPGGSSLCARPSSAPACTAAEGRTSVAARAHPERLQAGAVLVAQPQRVRNDLHAISSELRGYCLWQVREGCQHATGVSGRDVPRGRGWPDASSTSAALAEQDQAAGWAARVSLDRLHPRPVHDVPAPSAPSAAGRRGAALPGSPCPTLSDELEVLGALAGGHPQGHQGQVLLEPALVYDRRCWHPVHTAMRRARGSTAAGLCHSGWPASEQPAHRLPSRSALLCKRRVSSRHC